MPRHPDLGTHVKAVAREWNKLQVAVLGFTGLCGVLQGNSGMARPPWLQDSSGIAAAVGLLLAVLGVGLVASVAFPLPLAPANPLGAARRLQLGIGLTFVAVVLTALSALSMWWPPHRGQYGDGTAEKVLFTTNLGAQCGTIIDGAAGFITVGVNGATVRLPLSRLVSIQPVTSC